LPLEHRQEALVIGRVAGLDDDVEARMRSAFVPAALVAAMTGISTPSFASSSVSFPADPYNGPIGDGGATFY
jgi:hypothetical protein